MVMGIRRKLFPVKAARVNQKQSGKMPALCVLVSERGNWQHFELCNCIQHTKRFSSFCLLVVLRSAFYRAHMS